MRHLRDLRQAGLTHVHLLPSYDFGSVPERAEDQSVPQVSAAQRQCTVLNLIQAPCRHQIERAHAEILDHIRCHVLVPECLLHSRHPSV